MRTSFAILAPVATLALLSCTPSSSRLRPSGEFVTLPPVALSGQLAYVERSTQSVYFLDPTTTEGSVRTAHVAADPVTATPRAAHPELLVLSRGKRADDGVEPEPAELAAIPVASGLSRQYVVGNPFNAFAQTSDGRFALVYFRLQPNLGRVLFNPNEVAIVDLDAAPDAASNPTLRTVRSFGGVPNDVIFSPPLRIAGVPRTLAVVLSDAYVTLMDLDHPLRPEVTVRLTLPEDARAIRPSQIVFDDTDPPTLFVRADASDDIYVLQLNAITAANANDNDYRPSITQLASGRRPSDMGLVGSGTTRRLLVVSADSQEANVVDTVSNRVTAIPLPARANRLLLFEGRSPRDPMVRQRALVYAADGSTTSLSFLDLEDLEGRRGRNLESVFLSRAMSRALVVPGQNAVVLSHAGGSTASGLSLLNLTERTAAPILAEFELEHATVGADGRTLWVASPNQRRVGIIDLGTLHPSEILLDAPVTDVLELVGAPAGVQTMAVIHPDIGGSVTMLDARDPSRMRARAFRGFLYTNLLEGEPR